ncbi:hypothetical protein, partial [Pusillimonas noertemannii]|uniref:hypothetical protein n=1 Tax=Pusillimonas noertemannii TaxID=305977 RepID=UPI00333EE088
ERQHESQVFEHVLLWGWRLLGRFLKGNDNGCCFRAGIVWEFAPFCDGPGDCAFVALENIARPAIQPMNRQAAAPVSSLLR